ncbi:hypothetical protein EDD15DRAFT_2336217, partial [Pisolithus albus]
CRPLVCGRYHQRLHTNSRRTCPIQETQTVDTYNNFPMRWISAWVCHLRLHQRKYSKVLNPSTVVKGMKVMVTENVETDLDITNGSRGVVVGIICHLEETGANDEVPQVSLQCLPSFILVKMDRTRTRKLTDLDESVVPIEPTTRSF